MIEDHTEELTGEKVLFDVIIYPNRSLPAKGFLILMILFGVVSFVAGMVFLLNGAWPVLGFFGLDVLLLFVAFKLNYRSGRMMENVHLTRDRLTIIRTDQNKRVTEITLQPYWARIDLSRNNQGEVDYNSRMILSSHGRSEEIASFLSPEEKLSLYDALRHALLDARS